MHLDGPLSGKFKHGLDQVGLGDKFDGMSDKIRHQFHVHTNHYSHDNKNKQHVDEPVGNVEISELMVAKKVVV